MRADAAASPPEECVPNRFIFRQVYYKDVALFVADGEVRAKNHPVPQACHQTSYQDIVARRGTADLPMPGGSVVNDYVPFYFSPITAFTYTIFRGNVSLRSPDDRVLGTAVQENRPFLVAKADRVLSSGIKAYFSNIALNRRDSDLIIESDPRLLEQVVNWSVFDDSPRAGHIPEVGYEGVCSYFSDRDTPVAYQKRKSERMAEFLVHGAVPLDLFECIVVHDNKIAAAVTAMLKEGGITIPVYVKPGCYF
jgi:hypothetical protein